MDKKTVVVMRGPVGYGTRVINLDVENHELNGFLAMFDVWGSKGQFKDACFDTTEKVETIQFEMLTEFYSMITSENFRLALSRFGVKVVKY